MASEPFSTINGLLDQNILIVAYEEPLTVQEIAERMGVATAYIESAVEKLVNNEIMQKTGNKVYTDFLITTIEDEIKNVKASIQFTSDSFDDVKDIFKELFDECRASKILEKFNDTQLYSYIVLTMSHFAFNAIQSNFPILTYEQDFPNRPNGGKWIAQGSKSPSGYKPQESITWKYNQSGRLGIPNPCDGLGLMQEWSINIGKTHTNINLRNRVDTKQRTEILYKIYRKEDLNAWQMESVPDFVRYNFLTDDNGEKIVCVPIISANDHKKLESIINAKYKLFVDKIRDKIVDAVKNNIIKYPKHIKNISNNVYTGILGSLASAYIYKAAEQGIIEIKEDVNYPVMIMVEK
jgi:RNA polymerase sigma-70 factor (ECF subfamily)